MVVSIPDIPKKRGRKPSGGRKPGVMVRLPDPLLTALDGMIAEAPSPLTRPEAIRALVEDGLKAQGRLPHRENPEMAN
jgi:metal-responsive CopG/Arc/MetJ family transcriptional regulator